MYLVRGSLQQTMLGLWIEAVSTTDMQIFVRPTNDIQPFPSCGRFKTDYSEFHKQGLSALHKC